MARLLTIAVLVIGITSGACGLTVDATKFRALGAPDDVCLAIQSAIASLPPSQAGAVIIDAREFTPSATTTLVSDNHLVCSVNPFTIASNNNPLVLAFGGFSGAAMHLGSPGSAGGVVLLPGLTIETSVSWIVPGNWSVIGEGAGNTVIQATYTVLSLPSTSVSTSSTSTTVTGNTGIGTGWQVPGIIGLVLMACGTGCTPGPTTASVVGIVTSQAVGSSPPTLTLSSTSQASLLAGSPYTFLGPIMEWATTTACTSGSCAGLVAKNTFGSVVEDVGLDCASVANCIPFWDQYGQERSQLKRVSMKGFKLMGLGVYTGNSQNGGPFDDLQMTMDAAATSNTICVELGGKLGAAPMRGIRGLTCTAPSGGANGGTGVDVNSPNFTLSDAHFESMGTGVEVGAFNNVSGILINNVTGGGQLPNDVHVTTIVDISNTNAGVASPTADIKASNISQPAVACTPTCATLIDHISGTGTSNTVTEAQLGFYDLGDGTGAAPNSTRPVLTTSSSVNGNLNALTLGVAGATTGTLSLASSGGGTAALTTASTASSQTHTLPANTGTIAETNLQQSFSALQTFQAGSGPCTTLSSAYTGQSANTGWSSISTGGVGWCSAGSLPSALSASGTEYGNTSGVQFGSSTSANSSAEGGVGTKGKAVVTFDTNTPGNASGFYKSSQILQVASNTTTTGATLGLIAGLAFTAPTNLAANWSYHCSIAFSVNSAATVSFGIQGANFAPTYLMGMGNMYTALSNANAQGVQIASGTTSKIVVSGAVPTTTILFMQMDGTLEAASNSTPTTLNIMDATSAGTLTVFRGSFCTLN